MKELTCADFTPLVNQNVKVTVVPADPDDDIPAVEVELKLVEVNETGDDMCEGFSLVFSGTTDKTLPQRTYQMQIPSVGEAEIFIVPVASGKDGKPIEGQAYQAVFNKLKPAAAAANPPPSPMDKHN